MVSHCASCDSVQCADSTRESGSADHSELCEVMPLRRSVTMQRLMEEKNNTLFALTIILIQGARFSHLPDLGDVNAEHFLGFLLCCGVDGDDTMTSETTNNNNN